MDTLDEHPADSEVVEVVSSLPAAMVAAADALSHEQLRRRMQSKVASLKIHARQASKPERSGTLLESSLRFSDVRDVVCQFYSKINTVKREVSTRARPAASTPGACPERLAQLTPALPVPASLLRPSGSHHGRRCGTSSSTSPWERTLSSSRSDGSSRLAMGPR